MSRYINTDFILDGIKNDRALIKDGKMDNYKEHYLAFLEKCVELTPSIDIVRCKECKYKCIYDGETKYYYCALEDRPNRQWSVDETDYCSWGERKSDE